VAQREVERGEGAVNGQGTETKETTPTVKALKAPNKQGNIGIESSESFFQLYALILGRRFVDDYPELDDGCSISHRQITGWLPVV
jgi:hypothetical protein